MSRLFETLSQKPPETLIASEVARPSLSCPEFSLEHRRTLLGIAHQAIVCALEREPFPEAPALPAELSEARGVFTTLYLDHDLRGCVGYAVPVGPLYRAVAETARSAAFDDSRFLPVKEEEAARLEVSLSVLSRLFPIQPGAIEVGRHGLVISQGGHRGLLLPQVPVEHGWGPEAFLQQACRKAGLPLDAWRKSAIIEAFTAEVFSDPDVAGSV